MSIDPNKLLELCRSRHHDGGVTLSWPTMVRIIDQLRQNNALVVRLHHIDRDSDLHPHQQWDEAKEALAQHLDQLDHIPGASKKVGQI